MLVSGCTRNLSESIFHGFLEVRWRFYGGTFGSMVGMSDLWFHYGSGLHFFLMHSGAVLCDFDAKSGALAVCGYIPR